MTNTISGTITDTNTDVEKSALLGTLDAQRSHIVAMLEGLDGQRLRTAVLPSGWHCLGLIRHLTAAEDYWFGRCMDGEAAVPSVVADDAPDDWTVSEDEPATAILERYREVTARSNAVIDTTSLDAAPRQPDPVWLEWGMDFPDLRTILLHMIVETAVHAGHLDAARELIDGRQWIVL